MGSVHVLDVKKSVVLIVEHEALIRMNIVQVVEDAGCEVLQAASADEAIKHLEQRDSIRAVFTDVVMPGSMDGLGLARAISDRWPSIRIIVTSGLNVSKHPDFPVNARFIGKPYQNEEIAAALRESLGTECTLEQTSVLTSHRRLHH